MDAQNQPAEAGLQERTVITPQGEILTIVYAAKGGMLNAVYAKAAVDKTATRVTGNAWQSSLALAVASPTTFAEESTAVEQTAVDRLVSQGIAKRAARNAGGVLRRPRAILKGALELGIDFDAGTGRNALERAVKSFKADADAKAKADADAKADAAKAKADADAKADAAKAKADAAKADVDADDVTTLRDILARNGEEWIISTLAEFAAAAPQQATAWGHHPAAGDSPPSIHTTDHAPVVWIGECLA